MVASNILQKYRYCILTSIVQREKVVYYNKIL